MLIEGTPVVHTDINVIVIHDVLCFSDVFTCQRVMLNKLIGTKGPQKLPTADWSPIQELAWRNSEIIVTKLKLEYCENMEILLYCEIDDTSTSSYEGKWSFDSPHQRRVIRSFDIFLLMNKLLKKQSRCRWDETPWLSCDATVIAMWSI